MTLKEFNLIERYFQHSVFKRNDVVLGVGDDCALLKPPSDHWLAVTTDTLNEGVHFLPNTDPKTLGHKSLAVSLSDLAAMGAEPAWALLSLTLPAAEEIWLSTFCEGFFKLAEAYSLQLVGGNTTRGALAVSTHLTGFIPHGKALCRNGTKPGDDIYVTGTLGDAALALSCLQGNISLSEIMLNAVKPCLEMPTPRVACGLVLRDIATAAIDISDGFLSDLGHLLKPSNVGATLYLEKLPFSEVLRTLPFEIAAQFALTGGDDYELCFTASPDQRVLIKALFADLRVPCTRVGNVKENQELKYYFEGIELKDINIRRLGYEHFNS